MVANVRKWAFCKLEFCAMKHKKPQSIKADDELEYIPIDVDNYIDIEEIKKEFSKSNEVITDDEAEKIKLVLEQIMEFSFIRFQQHQHEKQKCKIVEFNTNEEESHLIYTSKYRRAS